MKTIQFQDLVSTEFDIHDIIIINHAWRPGESYAIPSDGRPDNGLMFLSDIDIDYVTPDGRIFDRAKRNNIVYCPIGSKYICRFNVPKSIPNGGTTDYLINFRLFDANGEEFRLSDDRLSILPDNPKYYLESFSRIDSIGRKGLLSPPRIKGMMYNLLCDIALGMQKRDIMTRRFASIYPAIKYIRSTDIAEIDVEGLAAQCHLSKSGFRRLFREYTGMAPLEYVNHMKAAQAKARLKSGVMTVAEVAESLGFSDPSYFSRFYRRATGRRPSEDLR